jgi:hypothetical protein
MSEADCDFFLVPSSMMVGLIRGHVIFFAIFFPFFRAVHLTESLVAFKPAVIEIGTNQWLVMTTLPAFSPTLEE